MFSHLSGPAKAAIFYAIALVLAFLLAAFFTTVFGEATAMLTMLTPAVATLAMLVLVSGESRSRSAWLSLGVTRAGFSGWWLAILGPAVILLASDAILVGAGLASLHAPVLGGSAVDITFNLAASLAAGVVLAFGEEVGWRGYMLSRLAPIGLVPAMLIVGLAHGVWHLPLMLMTPYYHSGGNVLIVVPLFLITLTLAGLFYGYLRVWTGSLWPVAIAHAVYNFFWNLGSEFVVPNSQETMEYVGGESGILVIAGLLIAAPVFVRRLRGMTLAPDGRPVSA